MKIRLLVIISAALLLQACQDELRFEQQGQEQVVFRKEPVKPDAAVSHDTACIAAVGDIMLGSSYPDNKALPPANGIYSFKSVATELRSADVAFGNLEGALLDTGAPAYFKLHQLSKSYLFRMPVRYGRVLKDAGFDVLSLANNHIGDFGDPGRKSTMHILDSLGISYGGQESHPSSIFTIKGITYGFCAFAPNSQTLSIFGLKNASRIIQNLKQHCDIVIVSFHGGGEGIGYEHVPCANESFNKEKRGDVHAFAHNAIDAGADLVFGNGPHVCRAMEVYKNRLIAYSLGNFCTYKNVSVNGICGLAPLLKVYVSKKGEFLTGKIISFGQTHSHGLQPDSLNQSARRIRLLTQMDFEQPGLSISDDGVIMPVDKE